MNNFFRPKSLTKKALDAHMAVEKLRRENRRSFQETGKADASVTARLRKAESVLEKQLERDGLPGSCFGWIGQMGLSSLAGRSRTATP